MQNKYLEIVQVKNLPPIPVEGSLDLTYRCNNNCRHCWSRIPPGAEEKSKELTFGEIKSIVDQARKMGCRKWVISGGEPMIRPDFAEIFDYITTNCAAYSLNTNGTLINPRIARLMKRKGNKMVALYGATSEVNDHITRNPGSFEATMRGMAYLREAGAGFTVQVVPMRDNYHQFRDMVKLAKSLARHYRIGASWLFLSMRGDRKVNQEIMRQRLSPKEAVKLDQPDLGYEERSKRDNGYKYRPLKKGDYLFSNCAAGTRDFDIDAYGRMTFCCFVRDPNLRYDLRKGSFRECWDKFIPSLARKVKITQEYQDNCGPCELKEDCPWCPAYSYLEHQRYSAKIDYFCDIAREKRSFKEKWAKKHRRYYKIAGITVQVDSDVPIKDNSFHPKFRHFEVDGPGEDNVLIRHYFSLPDLNGGNLGQEVYRKPPWAIYKRGDSWIYGGIANPKKEIDYLAVFNRGHTRARIYSRQKSVFLRGGVRSLSFFPTDQIFLARVLADRQGFYLHSCGVDFKGKGFVFAGHSDAGKSTIARMLKPKAEILCDDRIIVRKTNGHFRIYGTWSHGDVPDVSAASAALKAIVFLEKAKQNRLIKLNDKKELIDRLLAYLVKPFVTVDWWEKTLNVVNQAIKEVPCYALRFNKSIGLAELLNGI